MDAIRIGGINATKERQRREGERDGALARRSLSFCVVGNIITAVINGNLDDAGARAHFTAAAATAPAQVQEVFGNPLGNFAIKQRRRRKRDESREILRQQQGSFI